MKTKISKKQLTLNKKTISHLNNKELGKVHGGGSHIYTCQPCDTFLNSCIRCIFI